MKRGAAVAVCTFLCAAAAWAGGPAGMVRDIRTEAGFEQSPWEWDEYVELDGAVYFAADDGVHGRELWRWAPGRPPAMLTDICPGVCGSKPSRLTLFEGQLFFSADDGAHGEEPWLTDGSLAGTRLILDILPGGGSSSPDFPAVLGSSLYFAAEGSPDDSELWTTDGIALGTERVLDIEPGPVGSEPTSLVVHDDRLYFTARTTATGRELWETDGSPGGTTQVVDHCPGDCDAFDWDQWTPLGDSRLLKPSGGNLLVLSGETGQLGLYALEQSPPNLVLLVSEIRDQFAPFPRLGDRFFFSGCEPVFDCEPWSSDGTPAGTSRVADVNPGADGSYPVFVGVLGSELLFFANDGTSGGELWKSDGTEAGTGLLVDIAAGPTSSAPILDRFPGLVVGDRMVFRADDNIHGDEFWTTDGTVGGTELLIDIWPGPRSSQAGGGFGRRIVVGGYGLISANNLTVGFATWATDGTPAGTSPFLDSNQQASALELRAIYGIPDLRAGSFGDRLLFGADDGLSGEELWITDGTAVDTNLVADLKPGEIVPGLAYGSYPRFFLDGDGIGLVGAAAGVWATDGELSGTLQLSSGGASAPFVARPAGEPGGFYGESIPGPGSALAATDGTPRGTELLVGGGVSDRIAILDDSLLIFARDTSRGSELWSYPLPSGPPALVADIYPGSGSSWPEILGRFGDEILFAASDPVFGRELWATDGTAGGTRLVRDIAPGADDGSPVTANYEELSPVTSAGLFFVADDGETGAEPWLTDGTEIGTVRVADLWPGSAPSDPAQAVAIGDRVFFLAADGVHGRELWVMEGGRASLVRDIRPGPESSVPERYSPRRLGGASGRVFFGATDGKSGLELWVSDGSGEGTWQVQDINPGAGSSSPAGFATAGERVYFSATDGVHGFEVWSLREDFEIFEDGFESGDTSAWSVTFP